MKVKYSDDVKLAIQQYAQSLKKYPISKERRNQKVKLLHNFLRNTIRTVSEAIGCTSYPQCKFADLGQVFGQNNEPLNQYLRQTHFADESETKWLISFMLLEDSQTILIISLKQSQCVVKESIVIQESQLQKMIGKSIRKVLRLHKNGTFS